MAEHPSSQNDLANALEHFFRAAEFSGIVSVYLFGSHAEGRAHRESDVDLGVLLRYETHDTARNRFEERVRRG